MNTAVSLILCVAASTAVVLCGCARADESPSPPKDGPAAAADPNSTVPPPAPTPEQRLALRLASRDHMRMIGLALLAWCNDHQQQWPAKLTTIQSGMYDPREALRSPSAPQIAQPFLYVRPAARAPRVQPVIVEDPACNQDAGSWVLFSDSRCLYVTGTDTWIEAQRLSRLPKAHAGGIELIDWTFPAVPRERSPDPGPTAEHVDITVAELIRLMWPSENAAADPP